MTEAPQTAAPPGAHMEVREPPKTSLGQMIWNGVGSLIVIALCVVANNLYQINLTLATDAVSKKQMVEAIAENKAHLVRHDIDISQLQLNDAKQEGRMLRGAGEIRVR